jgi:hypothetical protein
MPKALYDTDHEIVLLTEEKKVASREVENETNVQFNVMFYQPFGVRLYFCKIAQAANHTARLRDSSFVVWRAAGLMQ